MANHACSAQSRVALAALVALPLTSGCKTDDAEPADAGGYVSEDAGHEQHERDGGDGPDVIDELDASGDGATSEDGGSIDDAGLSVDADGDSGSLDAGSPAPAEDPLAPFELDCADLLPTTENGCQGGPREVLLVTEETGLIVMLDPVDGHFLGYFKRPSEKYFLDYVGDYWFATQGPDQCVWSVSEDDDAQVERWNTDGSFKDMPLERHYIPVPGSPDAEAIDYPVSLAFTEDHLYVASSYFPNITRWNVADGSFDSVVLESGSDITSLLVLGDGSLLIADDAYQVDRVARIPAGGGAQEPVLGDIYWTAQLAYAGDGQVLVTDTDLGRTPIHKVDIESGNATSVIQNYGSSSNKWGIAQLKNGKWLVVDGQTGIVAIDPGSTNPTGQYEVVYNDDPAIEAVNFKHIGRACLSEEFVASRAPKPADNTCIAPPDGASILEEDFEGDGDFEGSGKQRHYNAFYDHGTTGVTSSLVTGPDQDNTSRVLKVEGAGELLVGGVTRSHKTGIYARFPAAKPRYISYRVWVGNAASQGLGYFNLENEEESTYEYDRLAGTYLFNSYFRGANSNASTLPNDPPNTYAEQWIKVEMRNIDWEARTYDLYLNCTRLAEAIHLPNGFGENADLINLYNWAESPDANTVSYYDDILIK